MVCRRLLPTLGLFQLLLLFLLPPATLASGARLFKSGPIQITADGQHVWVANEHGDSVTRIATADDSTTVFALPDGTDDHRPTGLSVTENGSRVWVACRDSDRVYVLDGSDGTLVRRIDLPWGSGPYAVALSRPGSGSAQDWALVTLHRGESLVAIDTATFQIVSLGSVYRSPLGVAFMEDGVSAWVTHLFAQEEHPRVTRVDFSGPTPKVTTRIEVGAATPRQGSRLSHADPARNVAEGGYLNFRGHLAQLPSADAGGLQQLWIPTQYHNMTNDIYTPDSTIQASLRKLDLTTRVMSTDDKIVFTAIHVHDPTAGDNNPPWIGHGWDAGISGAVDLGFVSVDGSLHGLVVGEQSDDVIVFPWTTGPVRSATDPAAPGLPEVPVGSRPMGIAVSPTAPVAFVYNNLSFDVSVLDLSDPAQPLEDRRIAIGNARPGSPLDNPTQLLGAQLFHSSADPRSSANAKVACASCHMNGEHDGRAWQFQHLPAGTAGQGHGPRQTPSLLGIGRTHTPGQLDPDFNQLGQLHRSGDRDELQDFEHTYQGVTMGGTGFLGATVQPELGAPNRGLDPDLDAVATYMLNLPALARSPYRAADGDLSEAALRGATFFNGTDVAGRPGDANCASCHDPSLAFQDFRFHDVGQRRDGNENELNDPARPCDWCVNTPSLLGVWTKFPLTGVLRFPESFLDALLDFNDPARALAHGDLDGLSGRQLTDLAEFVLSIDGELTAQEVAAARDTEPPRIVRVEPASKTRLSVWFDETIDPGTATDPANYRITRLDTGQLIPVSAVALDPQNGDRVTLTTALEATCAGTGYTLEPAGGILDEADDASGNTANLIDTADPGNAHAFVLTDSIRLTLGASGYETLTVPVHDASPVGSFLRTWSHDSLFPYDNGGGTINPGFLRFDWRDAFVLATGVSASSEILDAAFSVFPLRGDAQNVEIRRTLQSWSDPPTGNDWNQNPVGAPTWRDHSHPNGRWNVQGARALGSTGGDPADYDGAFDLAATIDAVGAMSAVNEPLTFDGAGVTDAFRFWFDHPAQDYGYALRVVAAPPAIPHVKFHRSESDLRRESPLLDLTYAVSVPPVSEVSGGSAPSLRVDRAGADVVLSFEDLGSLAGSYNVYEGQLGDWYSHSGTGCNRAPTAAGPGRLQLNHTPAAGDRYFLVTASDPCMEGTAGFASSAVERDPARLDCGP